MQKPKQEAESLPVSFLVTLRQGLLAELEAHHFGWIATQ